MTEKKLGPDLIKFISIFSVIGVHFILNTMDNVQITTTIQEVAYFSYRQLFIICVPLFMLTSGYLNSMQTISRKYYMKIFPILTTYIFYSILSIFFRILHLEEDISFLRGLFLLLNFNASPYNWYLNMYLGLFLLAPFFNNMLRGLTNKQFQILLFIFIGITILPLTFNFYPSLLFDVQGIILPNFWISLYPITYYLTGSYIKRYPTNKKYLWLILLVAIFSILISVYFSKDGYLSKVSKDYGNILTYLQSSLMFSALINFDHERLKQNNFITFVATNTLSIYLVSYISDQVVYQLGRSLLTESYLDFLFSPLFVISSFLLAVLIVKISNTVFYYVQLILKNLH